MLKNLNDFHKVQVIVTHPGGAHRDEFLATCIALSLAPHAHVFRQDATDAALNMPSNLVIDVGQRHEPHLMNFDHHQFSREAPPTSALTLVLQHLGILDAARKSLLWMEFTEILDSKGPVVTAKWLGTSVDKFMTTVSPVENWVLRRFGEYKEVPRGDILHGLMVSIGHDILAYLTKFAERYEKLGKFTVLRNIEVAGEKLLVIDASFLTKAESPTLALEAWIKDTYPHAAATITEDDRGDGKTVFRRNDHPMIDFSRLEGQPGVVFAHKNGFVAKLAYDMDPMAAIRAAVK